MEKKEKPKRGRPRHFARDDMLEKASELFWQQGYEGTSISDLVSAMGVTPPSLYSAFKSKESLYLEVLDRYAEQYGSQILAGLFTQEDAFQSMKAVLYSSARVFTHSPHAAGCMISTGLVERAEAAKGLSENLKERRNQTTAAIQAKLEDGKEQLQPHTDVHALAAFLAATIQGMSIQAKDGASEADLQKLADLSLQVIAQALKVPKCS
ncbi:TetR/AcrR family transcriptional regulator [Flexibacterium corallicola]|uniref:TetR/AcrR family transcriptional regulator n=1 Tax=Flexibacterium corallicola TaxID=3037259 RepID=UPI00286EC3D2|nr:TetR/AcrR family transcriptional regulator [Pseudovibrio sp. M1P-2-3]